MKAWHGGLISPVGRGLYRAICSAAGEQFFWEGPKRLEPRSFTLWLEPIITVAALARLHFDFGWPVDLIGTQSIDGAFDIVAFSPFRRANEHIAGEVKKSEAEVEMLLLLMQEFGREPLIVAPTFGRQRNAYKKMAALRARNPPLFWAVGPAGYSRVFKLHYLNGGLVRFAENPTGLSFDLDALRRGMD
jgi:hypothetical protein